MIDQPSPSPSFLSRNVAIAGGVVLFHVALLWAIQSGLIRRAVEVIVPVEVLSEIITPPAPKRHLMRLWLSAADGRELPDALLAKWPVIERGRLRGGAVIAPDREWVVPLEPETPAY